MWIEAEPLQHCATCHRQVLPDDEQDVLHHREYHQRFLCLAAELGRAPAGYSERERTKVRGYRLVERATSMNLKLVGADLVLVAMHDREAMRALKVGEAKTVPFRAFVLRQDLQHLFGASVAHALHAKYR